MWKTTQFGSGYFVQFSDIAILENYASITVQTTQPKQNKGVNKMKCCNSCSPVKPGSNINSPYANLTGGIFNFNYCPYCGRKLKDEHGKRINIEIDIKPAIFDIQWC